MALAKIWRLTGDKLIERVFKGGYILRTPFFRITYIPTQAKTARLAFVVSKKSIRSAVDRNKLKRRLKNAVYRVRKEMPMADMIITALPDAMDTEFDMLIKHLIASFDKIKKASHV